MTNKQLILISLLFLSCIWLAQGKKPDGVSCVYTNSTRFLQCNSTTGSEVCQADILGIAHDFHTYRIGILKASRGNNNQKWFRLFALKEDKSGWYYFKGVKNAHLRLTLHTKAKKNKKYNKGFVVLDNDCWTRLSEIIESSVIVKTIKIEKYGDEGFYDEEEAKVAKTIGSLRIVD